MLSASVSVHGQALAERGEAKLDQWPPAWARCSCRSVSEPLARAWKQWAKRRREEAGGPCYQLSPGGITASLVFHRCFQTAFKFIGDLLFQHVCRFWVQGRFISFEWLWFVGSYFTHISAHFPRAFGWGCVCAEISLAWLEFLWDNCEVSLLYIYYFMTVRLK